MEFERIWQAPPFSVDFVDGEGGDLVIAFSSIGHDPSRPPSPEFVATATGRGTGAGPRRALFVMDASRSWANDPGFASALRGALARVEARAPVRRIATIGGSMGGFCALAAAQVIPVDAVLAFSPQYSVMPAIFPGETRWSRWTGQIRDFAWPSAPLPGRGQGWACLFHGARDDLAQASRFERKPGTDHLIFPSLGHSDLVPHLKRRGVLSGLVEAAFEGDRRRLLRIAASSGGILRHRFSARF
ncbi:hypothetical protein [Thioclava atlantica]|uniref:Esterase n=1 Tax=Thioclava atlantica TaxID=1317124 RepID=A0A085U0S8_9RHOB|nr:hypothetical protein [Thioclava atlantica]KFE36575.1 hypothetical protein DW2_00415 [Thioclava atlantica]